MLQLSHSWAAYVPCDPSVVISLKNACIPIANTEEMDTIQITETESAALEVLRKTGIDVLTAALLAREALEVGRGRVKRARECLQLGAEQMQLREKTVSFGRAVEEAIAARKAKGLRERSIVDFRYLCRRLMRFNPSLSERKVRSMTPTDCRQYLARAFGNSVSQYKKARAIMSGVFSTSIRHGWCDSNPVAKVEVPVVREKPVRILEMEEIQKLLNCAEEKDKGVCLPAVAMMLYAGIRPHEVERLTWAQVDMAHGSISILAQHSKTGGARRVSIQRPLARLLKKCPKGRADERICPRNWRQRWRHLRLAAGWGVGGKSWTPDVLRHTFASYHLSHYRDYTTLQWEMGHRSSALLRTRYVDMSAIHHPAAFWK